MTPEAGHRTRRIERYPPRGRSAPLRRPTLSDDPDDDLRDDPDDDPDDSNDTHQGAPLVSTGTNDTTAYTATPIAFTDAEFDRITFNGDGLVGAIVQDASDSAVLMFAWMNSESLRRTLDTGRTWFWSRSRQEYWCKGETSGDRQYVRSVRYDCDGDTLLIEVAQEGAGACHTGHRTCFYRSFGDTTSDR